MIGGRRERDPLSDDLAALDDLQDEAQRPIRRPTALIVPILITMIVMTGGVTIAWYSYNAGVKEGSEGAAPLLKPDGPMKVAPANPGGTQIPHKDISIYQSLNEDGKQSKVERILPPPEQPLMPPAEPPTAGKGASQPGETGENSRVRSADTVPGSGDKPAAEPGAPSARSLIPPSVPSAPTPGATEKRPQIAMNAPAGKQPEAAKPAEREVKAAPVKPVPTPAPAPEPKKVASLPSGAYKVQIGSVSSEEQASRLWKIQSGKSGGLLDKLSMNVERKVIKGKAYYRIQAGPLQDAASAKKLCADLKRHSVGCFVVYPK